MGNLSLNMVSSLGTAYVDQEDIRWLSHPQFLFNWEELKLTVAPPANKKRHGFVNGSW
jgi:hypothetical protein